MQKCKIKFNCSLPVLFRQADSFWYIVKKSHSGKSWDLFSSSNQEKKIVISMKEQKTQLGWEMGTELLTLWHGHV